MINPFEYKGKFDSPKMKDLFLEMKELTAKIALQHAEEEGALYDDASLQATLMSHIVYTCVSFKAIANGKMGKYPEILNSSDKVRAAARDTYAKVVEIGQNKS
ncbi:hypothetical protein [Erwinia phage FBB1]|nr:hypothetical protein [Erwinia phage FBB1]